MQGTLKLVGLVAGILVACPAWAQVISPGALQQLRIDEEERRRQIERIEQRQAADPVIEKPAETAVPKEDPAAVRFFVREIRFSPSKIFSAGELAELARAYEGREHTLASLQQLVQEVNDAYRQRGVVTAQALIPPQNVSAGIVEIRLVEGHLGSLLFDGNASTADGYIANRIGLKPGDLVDLPSLEADLLRFNRTNDVQLQAQLAPGKAFATTDLRLKVIEPSRHLLRVQVDNGGSRSTGEWRGGLTYINRSVLGHRDEFSLATTQSGGQESYSIGYTIPASRSGGRLGLAYYQDHTEIRHGPFKSLDITGKSESTVLTFRQPVHLGKASQVDLVAGARSRRTDNWISGIFLTSSDSLDASIGAEAQYADASGYWAGGYSYTRGSAEVVERSDYWYGRGWLRHLQRLENDRSLVGSLSFQNTSKPLLPSSEQFIIGGEGSVRGYPVGTWAGETGYTLSAEYHHPLGGMLLGDGVTRLDAQGFFYVDYGHVRPYRPPNTILRSHEQLASIGWGVNAKIGKQTNVRLVLSYAPDNIPDPMSSRFAVSFQYVMSLSKDGN